jgi:beta-galactosidase/beta-glucuronidase
MDIKENQVYYSGNHRENQRRITMTIPRSEYPRPQFVRPDWLCLNGEWEFEIDGGDSGLERGLLTRPLSDKIAVPFCPESELSGLAHTDFMLAVWYRKTITVPQEWQGRHVLLHFGAVDYDSTVWVNGAEVLRHRGGFTPFSVTLKHITGGDTFTVVVRARDDWRPPQARGKQSQRYASHGCHYTRTTGIWQTVWMEPIADISLKRPRITPDVASSAFHLELPLTGNRPGLTLHATLSDGSGEVATTQTVAHLDLAPRLTLTIPEDRRRLWSPVDPHLYDIKIELKDAGGKVADSSNSYAGLRSLAIEGLQVNINGKAIFQRLVLDQGYYPDGIMTAPTDTALIADIQRSLDAGFNGARLHQKVFEERFLFHADRLGYLVWGEFGDWGCNGYGPQGNNQQPGASYITQWLEVLERDYSHPSIIGWCPLNETGQDMSDSITVMDDVTHGMYLATKALDLSRPVLDVSGYSHRVHGADIYDSHDYIGEQEFPKGIVNFQKRHAEMAEGKVFVNQGLKWSVPYDGQPYFVSEFGGFKWVLEEDRAQAGESWGYGGSPASLEDFYLRFQAVCDTLLDNPRMFGYCYTQLTDISPELNGIYTYDRRAKFDAARLKAIQSKQAAIEK